MDHSTVTPHTRVNAAQAEKLFNIKRWKFWAAARSGALACERLGNGRILFKVADIEAALLSSKEVDNG